ncbi:MAG: hypothetical protein CML21_00585 [Rheinheimera sp.]|nr:hypothetical protein [Rheinheimera sp.]
MRYLLHALTVLDIASRLVQMILIVVQQWIPYDRERYVMHYYFETLMPEHRFSLGKEFACLYRE